MGLLYYIINLLISLPLFTTIREELADENCSRTKAIVCWVFAFLAVTNLTFIFYKFFVQTP